MSRKTITFVQSGKMSPERLEEKLALGTRARTFSNRKREANRTACRGKVYY